MIMELMRIGYLNNSGQTESVIIQDYKLLNEILDDISGVKLDEYISDKKILDAEMDIDDNVKNVQIHETLYEYFTDYKNFDRVYLLLDDNWLVSIRGKQPTYLNESIISNYKIFKELYLFDNNLNKQ